MKPNDGWLKGCSSTTEGPRCSENLQRHACLHSCFINDVGDLITSRESALLAPARSVDSNGKLFNSLPVYKIDDCEDVISWSWLLSNPHDVAISEKVKACKLSTITSWLASKSKPRF